MNKDEIQSLDGMPPVKAVTFDIVETLFSLDSLRPHLASSGLHDHHREIWFASFLPDAVALEIPGRYKPFRDIASGNLSVLLEKELGRTDSQSVDHIVGHADVAPAMSALLRDAGIEGATLTNNRAKVTSVAVIVVDLIEPQ